jgi:hypothetical protein
VRERDAAERSFAPAVTRLLGNEGVDARLPALDAAAAGLQQIFRRKLAPAQRLRRIGERERRRVAPLVLFSASR